MWGTSLLSTTTTTTTTQALLISSILYTRCNVSYDVEL